MKIKGGIIQVNPVSQRYTKRFTVKEWKKFNKVIDVVDGYEVTYQDLLTARYNVILVDHLSRDEKIQRFVKGFNLKNLDKALKLLDRGLDGFDQIMKDFDKGMKSSGLGSNKYLNTDQIFPKSKKSKSKDYSSKIWGKPKVVRKVKRTKLKKSNNVDKIFGGKSKVKVM